MILPFASQRPAIQLWALASSILLGLLVVLSGGSLMLASSLSEAYDYDFWQYPVTQYIGLGTLAIVWLSYMASFVLLMGYEDAAWRRYAVVLTFLICISFLTFILYQTGLPFELNGMKSVM